MESQKTADPGPFVLGDLCALMALGPSQLAAFLAPLRILREDGIYARPPQSEEDRDLALDPPLVLIGAAPGWEDAPIRLTRAGYGLADLPFPFRWSELLEFFDVEGDAAWEVERKLTNDPGRDDPRTSVDEVAYRRLAASSPVLAALIRQKLEVGAGGRWWRATVGTATCEVAEAVAGAAKLPAADGGTGKRWTPELMVKLVEYHATHGASAAAAHFGVSVSRVNERLRKHRATASVDAVAEPSAHQPFPPRKG